MSGNTSGKKPDEPAPLFVVLGVVASAVGLIAGLIVLAAGEIDEGTVKWIVGAAAAVGVLLGAVFGVVRTRLQRH